MTSVIKPNIVPAEEAVNEEDVTISNDATTTLDGERSNVDNELAKDVTMIGGGGRRSKRRRSQRNRTASCSSDNHQHLPSADISSSNRAAKVWPNERIKMPRMGGSAEGDGTMAGRAQISGTSIRHQTQLQARNTLKPRAPSNTTSFLMSDLEKRQHEEEDQQQQYMDVLAEVTGIQRGQTQKVGPDARGEVTATLVSGDGRSGGMVEDDATDIEEQRDVDFEECLFTAAIERIERLSREEVNRELLFADRNNRVLKQRVALLREGYQQMQEENRKLKSLLKESGITEL